MAEWLRRLIRNQLGIARGSSNLSGVESFSPPILYNMFLKNAVQPLVAVTPKVNIIFVESMLLPQVLVAQWIAHQTSNLGVAGSNPVEHVLVFRDGLFSFSSCA